MNGFSFEQYQQAAVTVAQVATNVLTQRPGTDPAMVRQWLLTQASTGDVWLFAELDDQRIGRFEPYEQATHHLSSSLKGMPVLVSNHTGLRLAFLLSPVRKLPKLVALPAQSMPGRVMIGQQASGGLAGGRWDKIGHIMVAGMTGSGKSYTVRSLVYQAMQQGFSLVLGDLDNNTFPMMANHPALLTPLAENEGTFIKALEVVVAEIENRKRLYSRAAHAGSYPENIEEYNQWSISAGAQPLKRLLVAMDEFNSAVENTGGPNGELAGLARQVVFRGRKFGITLVMASQDFSKEIVGKLRDQVGVMIVHRVKSADVARNIGLAAAAQISPNRPGRAMSDRWGLIQAFFIEKEKLISSHADGQEQISSEDRKIAERAMRETDGKVSLEVLEGFGLAHRDARRLQDAWKLHGWAANDPQRANGLYITATLADLLPNCQTRQTLPNP